MKSVQLFKIYPLKHHGLELHTCKVKWHKTAFLKGGLHALKGDLKVYDILIQVQFESAVLQKQLQKVGEYGISLSFDYLHCEPKNLSFLSEFLPVKWM